MDGREFQCAVVGGSLLNAAVKLNQKEVRKILLSKGLIVSMHCDDSGLAAFYCGARWGRLELARVMLAYDA